MTLKSIATGVTLPAWTVCRSREEVGRPDLPLLTMSAERGLRIRDLSTGRAPSDDLSGYRVVHRGDLVVNKLSARDGALAVSGYDGIVSPAYWVLQLDAHYLHPAFANHLFRSKQYLAEIGRRSKDMPPAQFDLPWDQFRTLPLTLPPLSEQRLIAVFLDRQSVELDRAIGLLKLQADLLKERASAVASGLLAPTAGATGAHDSFPWLADPGRQLVKLGRVCELQSGLTVDAQRKGNSTYPYLRVANVQDGSLNLAEVKHVSVDPSLASRNMLQPGDVLMTEGGDLDKLGRGAVWTGEIDSCLHQNHVFALRPHAHRMLPEFLAAMTRTHHARRYFEMTGNRTTNLASTSSSKILAFRFDLPGLVDQRTLLQLLAESDLRTDSVVTLTLDRARLLEERKQSLITAAVSGEFDVSAASGRGVLV